MRNLTGTPEGLEFAVVDCATYTPISPVWNNVPDVQRWLKERHILWYPTDAQGGVN